MCVGVDGRGRDLWERMDGMRMAAFDSSFTAGVFALEAGDMLSVQSDVDGATCNVIAHHDQTFIGAVRLQMAGLPSSSRDHHSGRRHSQPT